MHLLVSFKTVKCLEPSHYLQYSESEAVRDECPNYHGSADRRRPILSDQSLQNAVQHDVANSLIARSWSGDASYLRNQNVGAAESSARNHTNLSAMERILYVALSSSDKAVFDQTLSYTPELCQQFGHSSAEEFERCSFSHNKFERFFHPLMYSTKKCTNGLHSKIYEQING